MNTIKSDNKMQIIWMVILIGIGTIGRYVLYGLGMQPFPNFEIIMVLTFLAVMLLKPNVAIFVPLFSMIFSDMLIGNPIFIGSQMNRIVLFTYSGFTIIALINVLNKEKFKQGLTEFRLKNFGIAAGLGIGFVLLYDIWTNMGWWYLMYPHSLQSLAMVFSAGIPFMIYHLISGAVTFIVIALPVLVYVSRKTPIDAPLVVKNIQKIPVAIIAVLLIALSFTGTAMKVPENSEVWFNESNETGVVIVIHGEGWTVTDNLIIYEEESVFSILEKITSDNGLAMEYTYYEDFDSVLIDSINGDINGNGGKYWQYYINHEETPPMVGSDKYTVSNGDYIEWIFETIPY